MVWLRTKGYRPFFRKSRGSKKTETGKGNGGRAMKQTKTVKRLAAAGMAAGVLLILTGVLLIKAAGLSSARRIPLLLGSRYLLIAAGGALGAVSTYFGNTAVQGKRSRKGFFPYLLIAPAMIFLIIFVLYPILNVLFLSFFKGSVQNPTKEFVGLKNYAALGGKAAFLTAVKNTFFYAAVFVLLVMAGSLLMAAWLSADRRLNKFSQTAIFTPHLIATVSCAFIWRWILDFNDYGLLNTLLGVFGVAPIPWLESSQTAMWAIIAMNVWKNIGYYTLILIAAMKNIPAEIFEAATLDNASKTKCFFRITLPLISPQLFVTLILLTIGSFNVFDSVNAMTEGGPGSSTEVIARFIYLFAFGNVNSLGLGCAAAVFLMFIQLALTAVYFKVLAGRVHYS